ncbi:hypothetical protein OFS02_14425 [Brachyspira hyodysenteriae]|nr:hypothetical protein [Brachyspira hyodysenteriae]MDA0093442.1 hypothetical protein [Brachyspira hyodysenteriae]
MNKEYDMQNINYITAGELKELLKEVPDNYELLVSLMMIISVYNRYRI